jgi:hypothetical protein
MERGRGMICPRMKGRTSTTRYDWTLDGQIMGEKRWKGNEGHFILGSPQYMGLRGRGNDPMDFRSWDLTSY